MATATALPPPTVHDAAQALSAARERVREHQRVYDKLRHRRDIRATCRARSEWGLAILEFIEDARKTGSSPPYSAGRSSASRAQMTSDHTSVSPGTMTALTSVSSDTRTSGPSSVSPPA